MTALEQGQVDAVVIDLPTAFYLTAAQVPSAAIVGQLTAPGGDAWGALLEKDPALTPCVNRAIGALKGSGRTSRRRRCAHGTPRERARELLARFGLGGGEDERPDRLSGGRQQRVAIVRALATRPRALPLDEVTSALDPELVGEVPGVIRDLKAGRRDDADRDARDGLRARRRRRGLLPA